MSQPDTQPRQSQGTNPNGTTTPERNTTPARAAAARTNGAKSHGPTTPAGKAISAKNGIRHGLFSQSVVLEGEDPGAFLSLCETLKLSLAPRDETEHGLVETIAAARWRILRLQAILTASINREIHRLKGIEPSPFDKSNMGFIAAAYRNLNGGTLTPEAISHHELRLDRQIIRSIQLLLKLQGKADRTQDIVDTVAALGEHALVWDPNDRTEPYPLIPGEHAGDVPGELLIEPPTDPATLTPTNQSHNPGPKLVYRTLNRRQLAFLRRKYPIKPRTNPTPKPML